MASLGHSSPLDLAGSGSRLLLLEQLISTSRKADKTLLQQGGEAGGEVVVEEGGGGGEQLLCACTPNPVPAQNVLAGFSPTYDSGAQIPLPGMPGHFGKCFQQCENPLCRRGRICPHSTKCPQSKKCSGRCGARNVRGSS